MTLLSPWGRIDAEVGVADGEEVGRKGEDVRILMEQEELGSAA